LTPEEEAALVLAELTFRSRRHGVKRSLYLDEVTAAVRARPTPAPRDPVADKEAARLKRNAAARERYAWEKRRVRVGAEIERLTAGGGYRAAWTETPMTADEPHETRAGAVHRYVQTGAGGEGAAAPTVELPGDQGVETRGARGCGRAPVHRIGWREWATEGRS
jgi:hypothetical protein